MKEATRLDSKNVMQKAPKTFLEDANSFNSILTRELFVQAEVKSKFKSHLLQLLFLGDHSIKVGDYGQLEKK